MKIGVYTIAKNEGKHVRDWLDAVSEADAVCVTDTGSTDQTVRMLSDEAYISFYTGQFRFDRARNYALREAKRRYPEIEVWCSFDLDEYPEKGWREKLEAAGGYSAWRITIDNGSYQFQNIRCHGNGWEWKHACHEVLCGIGPVGDAGLKVVHHQDGSKLRDYLPLLELDARENPDDGRAWHYLGREYMYLGRWADAIEALCHPDDWPEEKSRGDVFLSRCYWHLGERNSARMYAWYAVQAFGSREAWAHLAWLLDEEGDPTAKIAAENALKITKQGRYPSEPSAWEDGWLKKLAEAD